MRIRAGFEIAYECTNATPMLLVMSIHPTRFADLQTPHQLTFDRNLMHEDYVDGFGSICTRITVPQGTTTIRSDFVIADSGLPDVYVPDAPQLPVHELPPETLVYLLGSRYCETDRLSDTAWSLFAGTRPGWSRVQAICDYVHEWITFG